MLKVPSVGDTRSALARTRQRPWPRHGLMAVVLRCAGRAVSVLLVLQSTTIVQIGHLSYGRCETTKCTDARRLQYMDIAGFIKDKKNAVLPLSGPGLTATWHRIANRPTRAARGREPHLSQKRITPAPANASNTLSCQNNRHNGIADQVPFWKAWTDLSHSALVQNVSHKMRCYRELIS